MALGTGAPGASLTLCRGGVCLAQSRNYELKYRRSRAAVEKMIDRAIPHLAPSGDQRMKDINDLVRSLGEPPVFRAVPCTPPAFA